jgi:hypothetical protein
MKNPEDPTGNQTYNPLTCNSASTYCTIAYVLRIKHILIASSIYSQMFQVKMKLSIGLLLF